MRRGTLLGLLGATAVAIGAMVWLLGDDTADPAVTGDGTDPQESASAQATGPEAPPAIEADARPLTPDEPPAAVTPAPAGDPAPPGTPAEVALVTGRVTHLDSGEPAVGLTIAPRLVGPGGALGEAALDAERTRSVTQADGRYVFAVTRACTLYWLEALPGPDTTRTRERIERDVVPGEEIVVDFAVGRGGRLAGSVTDRDGRPIAGATVHGFTGRRWELRGDRLEHPDRTAVADAAGHFELAGLGPSFLLAAEADGLTSHERLHGEVAEGARLDGLTLVVSPARMLSGRVLGPGETPVADARVTAEASGAGPDATLTRHADVYRTGPVPREDRTDAGGRFALDPLASRPYEVRVETGRHPAWSGRHAPGDGELVVRLASGATLAGTVLGADGAPVADAELRLGSAAPFEERNDRRGRTGAAGRFAFTGLADDEHAVLAVRAGGHAVHVEEGLVLAEDAPRDVTVRLAVGRRLAGTVVDVDGAPVAGAHVAIEGDRLVDVGEGVTMTPSPTWERRFPGLDRQRTGPDGRFAFDGLYDGVFEIAAEDDAGVTARTAARAGSDGLLLVLDPAAVDGVTFAGTAVDGATGSPVPEYFVTPMLPGAGGGLAGTSTRFEDEDGRYRLTGLEPGEIQLTAQAGGFAPWSLPLRPYEEGEHHVDIVFLPQRRVTLRVVGGDGEPLDVRLTFQDSRGNELMVESGPGSRNSAIRTGDDGEALAAGLPADLVTVMAKRGWLGPWREYLLDLRLPPTGVVELVYEDGESVPLVVFVLEDSAPDDGTPPAGDAPEGDVAGLDGQAAGESELASLLTPATEALASGRLRPLDVAAEIVVREADDDRVVAARGRLDPDGPLDQGIGVPGVDRPFVVRLEVPLRPVVVEVAADGYRTERHAVRAGGGVLLVLLAPE